MKNYIVALAALTAMAGITTAAVADDTLKGAAIGAGAGLLIAGPPGAVVGGVVGAVTGPPDIHFYHHHRVHMDGSRHYYIEHGERHYYSE